VRKLLLLLLTPLLALFFLVLGSPSANAFGGEVLGCGVDNSAWTANSCAGGGDSSTSAHVIHYAAHNLSGSYSMKWTALNGFGTVITASCNSPQVVNCIWSGCTASSTTCDIGAGQFSQDRTFTATLQLTQSGQTRSVQASAVIRGVSCPPTCQ